MVKLSGFHPEYREYFMVNVPEDTPMLESSLTPCV